MTRLFADDSSLFYAAAYTADIAGITNHELQLLTSWARQWLVTFNPLKTEAVLFTLKKLDFFPQLFFENIRISFVDSHKHLGVALSSAGLASSTLSKNALNQMCMSYMLPIVEYALVVWDGCSEQYSVILQKVQNEAALLVTGLTRFVSLENLFKECGWATLSQRSYTASLVGTGSCSVVLPQYRFWWGRQKRNNFWISGPISIHAQQQSILIRCGKRLK